MIRKKICIVMAALLCVAGLVAGCGEKNQAKNIDVEKLASDLIQNVKFQDQMTEITPEVFEALYQIDKSKVAEAAVYTSTGATAEEVAVIKAASSKDVDDVKQAVLNRIEFQKSEFKDYVPAELDKLSNPVLLVTGDYVILCISNDNTKAEDVIRPYE